MIRRLIIVLSILCLCVSCKKEYTCKIDYEINYPDTTLIKSYSFKCNSYGRYSLSTNSEFLYIYPNGESISQRKIDAVSKEGKIKVNKFRMFKENKEVGE